MDILGKIDDIRNKPEHVRRRFVWFFVLISMVMIVGIWLMSLGNSLQAKNIKNADKLEMIEGLQGKSNGLTYPQPPEEPNEKKSLLEDPQSRDGLK